VNERLFRVANQLAVTALGDPLLNEWIVTQLWRLRLSFTDPYGCYRDIYSRSRERVCERKGVEAITQTWDKNVVDRTAQLASLLSGEKARRHGLSMRITGPLAGDGQIVPGSADRSGIAETAEASTVPTKDLALRLRDAHRIVIATLRIPPCLASGTPYIANILQSIQ
jgi:hypothetical protein